MKRVLCICNTYYQLIIVIQMKLTILKKYDVSVVISDHSNDAATVANKLKSINLFKRVFFINTKYMDQDKQKPISAIKQIIYSIGDINPFSNVFSKNEIYDEIMYYNMSMSVEMIYNYFSRKNSNIVCSRFEEGIASYNNYYHNGNFSVLPFRMKLVRLGRRFLKKDVIIDKTKVFYCFYPNLYKGHFMAKKIPLIKTEDVKLKNILKSCFNIDIKTLQYKQKNIFFASIGDFEGGKAIGEVVIAKKIADIVGHDNFIVKVHPRDKTNAFIKAGLNVDKYSNIPWEVIQLNFDFNDYNFFTVTSSSVLSISLIQEKSPQIFFLYPLCNAEENKLMCNIIKDLEGLLAKIENITKCRLKVLKELKEIDNK